MPLTDSQIAIFKADMLANSNQAVIDALAVGDAGAIAAWYNLLATPAFWVYKDVVSIEEVSAAIELDDVASMTTGDNEKLKTFFVIRSESGVFASKASDRAGFDDIFSAAAGDDSQQALAALWKRQATNAEKLFATGTGSEASPADAGFLGSVTFQEVGKALNS